MLSAIGTHGPTVSPIAMGLLNAAFCCSRLVACKTAKRTPRRGFGPYFCLLELPRSLELRLVSFPMSCQLRSWPSWSARSFGAQRGVSFAILVTLASNAVLGHGWWSMFQMIGWGSVAAAASMMTVHDSRGELSMNRLLFASLWSVPVFSIIVSFSILDSSMSMVEFGLYIANGLLYDVLHFLGNVFFAMWFGQWFERLLSMNQPQNRLVQQENGHVSTF